jgi:hypothetical protein
MKAEMVKVIGGVDKQRQSLIYQLGKSGRELRAADSPGQREHLQRREIVQLPTRKVHAKS